MTGAPADAPHLPLEDGLRWSACVRDGHGSVVWQQDPDRVVPTASVGKILLLLETARQMGSGDLDRTTLLSKADDPVGDSGIWHLLQIGELPVGDVASLIGALSDNLATNVLLRHVGLTSVDILRESLGLRDTRLLDQVRSRRGPTHPPTLSTGRADELTRLVHRIAANRLPPHVSGSLVMRWLSGNTDLSMVAAPFDLDPLAHRGSDHPRVRLWNKTGTDDGVRADVGRVSRGEAAYSYAVLAAWDGRLGDRTAQVLAAMRGVGAWLAARLD